MEYKPVLRIAYLQQFNLSCVRAGRQHVRHRKRVPAVRAVRIGQRHIHALFREAVLADVCPRSTAPVLQCDVIEGNAVLAAGKGSMQRRLDPVHGVKALVDQRLRDLVACKALVNVHLMGHGHDRNIAGHTGDGDRVRTVRVLYAGNRFAALRLPALREAVPAVDGQAIHAARCRVIRHDGKGQVAAAADFVFPRRIGRMHSHIIADGVNPRLAYRDSIAHVRFKGYPDFQIVGHIGRKPAGQMVIHMHAQLVHVVAGDVGKCAVAPLDRPLRYHIPCIRLCGEGHRTARADNRAAVHIRLERAAGARPVIDGKLLILPECYGNMGIRVDAVYGQRIAGIVRAIRFGLHPVVDRPAGDDVLLAGRLRGEHHGAAADDLLTRFKGFVPVLRGQRAERFRPLLHAEGHCMGTRSKLYLYIDLVRKVFYTQLVVIIPVDLDRTDRAVDAAGPDPAVDRPAAHFVALRRLCRKGDRAADRNGAAACHLFRTAALVADCQRAAFAGRVVHLHFAYRNPYRAVLQSQAVLCGQAAVTGIIRVHGNRQRVAARSGSHVIVVKMEQAPVIVARNQAVKYKCNRIPVVVLQIFAADRVDRRYRNRQRPPGHGHQLAGHHRAAGFRLDAIVAREQDAAVAPAGLLLVSAVRITVSRKIIVCGKRIVPLAVFNCPMVYPEVQCVAIHQRLRLNQLITVCGAIRRLLAICIIGQLAERDQKLVVALILCRDGIDPGFGRRPCPESLSVFVDTRCAAALDPGRIVDDFKLDQAGHRSAAPIRHRSGQCDRVAVHRAAALVDHGVPGRAGLSQTHPVGNHAKFIHRAEFIGIRQGQRDILPCCIAGKIPDCRIAAQCIDICVRVADPVDGIPVFGLRFIRPVRLRRAEIGQVCQRGLRTIGIRRYRRQDHGAVRIKIAFQLDIERVIRAIGLLVQRQNRNILRAYLYLFLRGACLGCRDRNAPCSEHIIGDCTAFRADRLCALYGGMQVVQQAVDPVPVRDQTVCQPGKRCPPAALADKDSIAFVMEFHAVQQVISIRAQIDVIRVRIARIYIGIPGIAVAAQPVYRICDRIGFRPVCHRMGRLSGFARIRS